MYNTTIREREEKAHTRKKNLLTYRFEKLFWFCFEKMKKKDLFVNAFNIQFRVKRPFLNSWNFRVGSVLCVSLVFFYYYFSK